MHKQLPKHSLVDSTTLIDALWNTKLLEAKLFFALRLADPRKVFLWKFRRRLLSLDSSNHLFDSEKPFGHSLDTRMALLRR